MVSAATAVGSGIVSPSSRIPARCRLMASRIRDMHSSYSRAAATQPGRSGLPGAEPTLLVMLNDGDVAVHRALRSGPACLKDAPLSTRVQRVTGLAGNRDSTATVGTFELTVATTCVS